MKIGAQVLEDIRQNLPSSDTRLEREHRFLSDRIEILEQRLLIIRRSEIARRPYRIDHADQ
jgi:hypothetical protein